MRPFGITAVAALCLALSVACDEQQNLSQPDFGVSSIGITPASYTLLVGDSVQLTATVVMSNGRPSRSVSWRTSDATIASVSSAGLVHGVGAGVATITATSSGTSTSVPITVTLVPVASVTVSPASSGIRIGGQVQLTATPLDAADNLLSGRAITWSSDPGGVVTVSGSGLVTGVAPGSATITATSEGKSGTASVAVSLALVASVTVSPATAVIRVAGTVQLSATPKDSLGNVLTGRAIVWSSNATGIATVDQTGLVTGVALGPATITATSEGIASTAVVTVSSGSFGHVIIVAEENHDFSQVIGNASMPYLNALSNQYGLATGYYANAHPSIGNYFEVTVGDTIINNDNFTGTVFNDNIVRELVAAGKTWKAYIEGYPSYDANHVPVSYFSDVRNTPAQAANLVPFTQFATDLANGTLPQFSFITPNLCDDAHDCALSTADAWLQTNIAPLINSTLFQTDGLLVIWWDESASDNTNGGGRVAWTVVSPFAKRGYQSSKLYQHQSTLRLMLKGLGVAVFPGQAATAPDMDEFFTVPVAPASRFR